MKESQNGRKILKKRKNEKKIDKKEKDKEKKKVYIKIYRGDRKIRIRDRPGTCERI